MVGQKPFSSSNIHVEAVIIGEDKKPLGKKEQRIGEKLSFLQLQKMDKEELEATQFSKLDAENMQQGFPFMVIFYNPVKTVREFSVKIIKIK